MRLAADREGNIRRFSAKLGWCEHFDPKEIEILSSGAIPKLIPPITIQGRRNNVLLYDISAYSTLEYYLTCILSREQFADILLQCIDVFRQMQQLYLNHKNLVLELNKVYIQLGDRSVHFIYLPLIARKREASLTAFFRQLIAGAVRSTYEQASFLDACRTWIERPAPFTLSEFEGFIKAQTCVVAAGTPKAHVPPSAEIYPQQDRFFRPAPQDTDATDVGCFGATSSDNTSLLGETASGTVLLSEEQPAPTVRYYLQRLQTEELVELTHFPFLVGTELGIVAYRVSGNAAVSRRHAEFSIQGGECVIADQRSTNKTYVNDCALVPFIPQILRSGDMIRLGNEKFKFIREETI